MTTAIEPFRPEAPLAQFVAGGVAADVRLDGKRHYEIRLAGARNVSARLVALVRGGTFVELGSLEVSPGGACASRLPASLGSRTRIEQVFLEIAAGDDLRLRLQAPTPPRRSRLPVVAMLMVGVGAAATATLAIAPGVPVLAAPGRAVAGTSAEVGYALRTPKLIRYDVKTDDGASIASGTTYGGHGTITVDVPGGAAGHRLAVAVRVGSPLGDVVRTVSFPVAAAPVAPPAPPVARVVSFTAERQGSAADDSILASFLATGDTGTLTVTRRTGEVLAQVPFTRRGTARVAVPAGHADEPLDVRLDLRRGASRSTAALRVAPLATALVAPPKATTTNAGDVLAGQRAALDAAAADAARAPGNDDAPISADDGPSAASDGAGIDVPTQVTSGAPFVVTIRSAAQAMRLQLQDDAGTTLRETPAPAGTSRLTLTAPAVTTGRTFYVTTSFGAGNAQETVVRTVRVVPR